MFLESLHLTLSLMAFTGILGTWQLPPIAPWASTEGQRTEEFPKMAPVLDLFSSRILVIEQTTPNKDTKNVFAGS